MFFSYSFSKATSAVNVFDPQVQFGVEIDETQTLSVMEGDSVTLHTDVTELQRDHVLLWTFGPQNTHIAKINRVHNETFHNGADERLETDSSWTLRLDL